MRLAQFVIVASLAAGLSMPGTALHAQSAAKPVTYDDLQGTKITATAVYAQTFRRLNEDQIRNNTNTTTIELKIGPGDEIDQLHTVKITAPNGREVGTNSMPAKLVLNKPTRGRFGEIIWIFDDGKLVRLQTFESGGRKITLNFKRTTGGIACSIDAPFAREDGANTLQTTSAVVGVKIEMLSLKQTSTSCRVDKQPGS